MNEIMSPCSEPGCRELVPVGTGKCDAHRKDTHREYNHRRRRDPIRGSRERFYSTSRWQQVRGWYLRAHPVCKLCGAPGQVVDHVVPRHMGGDDCDETNLQTLCVPCHNAKTRREAAGSDPL